MSEVVERCVRPIENSYVVPGTQLMAGEYPGSPPDVPEAIAHAKLAAFVDAGVTAFVDLTEEGELHPYDDAARALAAERAIDLSHARFGIRDMDVCDATHMRSVLDAIDEYLVSGRRVYVHCWGGVGRTGLVIGCWLVRHGRTGDAALAEVERYFRTMTLAKVERHRAGGSPQTEEQRKMVRGWASHERPSPS